MNDSMRNKDPARRWFRLHDTDFLGTEPLSRRLGPHGGLNPNGRQYRKFAECCEQLAKWDDLEEHRSSLMEMAQLWRELAEETKDAG